jgi:hypothetical protein
MVIEPEEAATTNEDATMSQFIFLYRVSEEGQQAAMGTPEQAKKSMEIWLAWMRDMESKGHLRHGGQPLATAGKVVRGIEKLITDGPYVEVKDIVAGFTLIEASDLAEAVELSTGCPILQGGGSVEVRPVRAVAL